MDLTDFFIDLATLPEFSNLQLDCLTRGRMGNTPLHISAIRGDVSVCEALIVGGANVNAIGEGGYTPLHEAIEQGQAAVVKCLLKYGASLDISNVDGITPRQMLQGWYDPEN